MKLSALATFLPLLLSSSLVSATRDVIRARQAQVKRGLTDVCVALDLDVSVPASGQNIAAGHLATCLCLSALPGFLDSQPVAKTVINGIGRDAARNYFAGLIQNQKGSQQCQYPQNAQPFCSTDRPCDFSCNNGYTSSPATNPTDCVCQPPYSECNGVCGNFPHGCGSQSLSKKRDDSPTCPAGKTICGLPNGGSGYDCVDINGDAESCGGCTVAPPSGVNPANGKNCKAIANVDQVACENQACKVRSCKQGFKPSPANDACVQDTSRRVRQARGANDIDGGLARRDVTDIDSLFVLIDQHNLFVQGFNQAAAKANLAAALNVFDLDHALELLLLQNAFIDGINSLAVLKDRLGLNPGMRRRETMS